ncbi:MAG TPA: CBS domain-containing protein [Pyrinomonadaceae bacterium]|nr:CBS domain-containing protein [Pyrinomonadaceae bacterium]
MARDRNDMYDEREYDSRNERFRRERPWGYDDPYAGRSRSLAGDYSREDYRRGRFGERAEYDYDEPRYSGYSQRSREEEYREPYERSYERREPLLRRPFDYERPYEQPARSRLRCRDIMTRDLVVATRDTTLREVGKMMKEEDTGVIPVVDYTDTGGNGRNIADNSRTGGNYNYGKVVGLITDRDVVIRAVAEDKDCATIRAEEIMTTDVYTARPNDRVVDVIRKMGDKQVRRIPVVNENGILKGIISMRDIALETESDRELGQALEDISKESSFWGKLFN